MNIMHACMTSKLVEKLNRCEFYDFIHTFDEFARIANYRVKNES